MAIGLPNINIIFKQKAASAMQRSTQGIACIIIKDNTDTTSIKEYSGITDLWADKAKYTEDNYNSLSDALLGNPSKLIVCRIGTTEDTIPDALSKLVNKSFNWLGAIVAEAADQTAVATWVKEQNSTRTKRIKAITYKATTTDDMHIVNLINDKVKRIEDDSEISGYLYIGRLVGLFAGFSMDMSATYYELTDLEYVSDVQNIETQIDDGNLVLINDEETVRIARAVNSLKTLTDDLTEDMKFITIVEAMDMMYEDIRSTFKESYVGKYKNNLDNQMLFISAINSYFKGLANDEILDINYSNVAAIDTEAQREAWLSIGKTEASAWDDATIRKNTFKTSLFLAGDVKILNAMEDLNFGISMA